MKTKNYLALVLVAIGMSSGSAFAEKVGNGGVGYLCGNQVMMLDYYEALDRQISISNPPGQTSLRDLVGFYLKRLSLKDERSNSYREIADQILADIDTYDSNPGKEYFGKLVHFSANDNNFTDDSFEKFFPTSCQKKVQVINQSNPVFPEDRLFRVAIQWWDRMSVLQKAIAITHEIIYKEAISSGQTDSVNARYLNEHLTSDYFDRESVCSWITALQLSNFLNWKRGEYNLSHLNMSAAKVSCYDSLNLKSITSVAGSGVVTKQKITVYHDPQTGEAITYNLVNNITLDPSGKVLSADAIRTGNPWKDESQLISNGSLKQLSKNDEFYYLGTSEGDVLQLQFQTDGQVRILDVAHQRLSVLHYEYLVLDRKDIVIDPAHNQLHFEAPTKGYYSGSL